MTKRDRTIVAVLAVAAVLGGFFFLVVKPKRVELAAADDRVAQAQGRLDGARADLRDAARAKVAYRRDTATLALMGKAVPADDDVPSLLYQLHGAARQAGIDFDSVTVGGDAAAAAPAPAPAPAPAAADQGDAGSAPAAPAETPPGTTPGPGGVSALPLKITFTGQFFRLERFLAAVHRFARPRAEALDVRGRLLTVDAVSFTPVDGGVNAQITATAYVAPAAEPAVPAAPADAGGAAPTTSALAPGATS